MGASTCKLEESGWSPVGVEHYSKSVCDGVSDGRMYAQRMLRSSATGQGGLVASKMQRNSTEQVANRQRGYPNGRQS